MRELSRWRGQRRTGTRVRPAWAKVRPTFVVALCLVTAGWRLSEASTPLILIADPDASAVDPCAHFWEALVALSERPSTVPVADAPTQAVNPPALDSPTDVDSGVPEADSEAPVSDELLPTDDFPALEPVDAAWADVATWDSETAVVDSIRTEFTFTITPRNDATILDSRPNAVYGDAVDLRARGARVGQRSYLEFVPSGVGDAVQRATLRLYCVDGSADAGSIYALATDGAGVSPVWNETELTWNNAPRLRPTPLAQLGRVVAGSWVEIDVTAVVRHDGPCSFGLVSGADDLAAFAARESATPPELVVTVALLATPANTLPTADGDSYALENDGAFEVYAPGLLENDLDGDGETLVLVSSTQPPHGSLVAAMDGGFVYRPTPGYFGPDSFTYSVSDGSGGIDVATVAITVRPGLTVAPDNEPQPAAETSAALATPARIVPNPSRGQTWVEFELTRECRVDAAIYDARGHRVRVLAAGSRAPGRTLLPWSGTDDQGGPLPAGIYFLRLQLGEALQRHKIVLQR